MIKGSKEATGRRKRGLIEAAQAALAPRLALAHLAVAEHPGSSGGPTIQDVVDGMLFVPLRPGVRGAA